MAIKYYITQDSYTILKWFISKYVTLFITGMLRSDSISGIGRDYPPRVPVAESSCLWNIVHNELVFSPYRFAVDWRKLIEESPRKNSFTYTLHVGRDCRRKMCSQIFIGSQPQLAEVKEKNEFSIRDACLKCNYFTTTRNTMCSIFVETNLTILHNYNCDENSNVIK